MKLFLIPAGKKKPFSDSLLRDLSTKTGAKISRNSEGDLQLEGEGGSEWFAEQVLTALVLGFEYKRALKMLNDEFFLEVIDLNAAMWGKKNRIEQMKGRIIGTEGKAKATLEYLSDCWMSISDDKVALLGRYEDLKTAKAGVLKLLEGKSHGTVYSFLEKKKADK